jgi:hypothetical protein
MVIAGVTIYQNNRRAKLLDGPAVVTEHRDTSIYEYKGCLIHILLRDDGLFEAMITRGGLCEASIQTQLERKSLDIAKAAVDTLPKIDGGG